MKILISIFIMFFAFKPGLACTCVNTKDLSVKEHSKYLKNIQAIFEGEVVSVGEKRTVVRKNKGEIILEDTVSSVTFKIFRIWKGLDQPEVTVEADVASSCQFIPQVGNRFTVYASEARKPDGMLYIHYCSVGTFDDAKMKVEYGEGRLVQHPPPPTLKRTKPLKTSFRLSGAKSFRFSLNFGKVR